MRGINKVILLGRIGKDIDLKETSTGKKYVSTSLATNSSYKNRDGLKVEKTEWHRVQFWGNKAEILEKYCGKGSLLYIEGYLQTSSKESSPTNRTYYTNIVVKDFQIIQSKNKDTEDQSEHDEWDYYQPEEDEEPYF